MPSLFGSSPRAARISRTARSMRGPSNPPSPIPLTPHYLGQPAEVGENVRGLRRLEIFAGHEHRINAGLGGPPDVGDGVVAYHDRAVGRDAGQAQRLVEDLAPRLLDAEHRGGDDAVEVARPPEVLENLLELYVPVGDDVERYGESLQLLQHPDRFGVGVEGDPAPRHRRQDLGGCRDAQLPGRPLGVAALVPRELLRGAVLYVLPDVAPQAPPHRPRRPLGRQPAVAVGVGGEVLNVALHVEIHPEQRPVYVQKDAIVAHPSARFRAPSRRSQPRSCTSFAARGPSVEYKPRPRART